MISGQTDNRPFIGIYCGLLAKRKPHQPVDSLEYSSPSTALKILPVGFNSAHSDILDDARFITVKQYVGLNGIYINSGRVMCKEGSEYKHIERIRVMNWACSVVRQAQIGHLKRLAQVNVDGNLSAPDMFKKISEAPLKLMKKNGMISNFALTIPDGQNVLSTETLKTMIKIIPKVKIENIENEIAYVTQLKTSTKGE